MDAVKEWIEEWLRNVSYDDPYMILATGTILGLTFLILHRCFRARPVLVDTAKEQLHAVKEFVAPGQGPRFRKRDKFEFLSRRLVRKAKDAGSYIRGGQGRKRRDMVRLVKRVFHSKGSPDPQSQMLRPELPGDFLEEERLSEASDGDALPGLLMLVLKNLRVFGHMDNAILLEVMKNLEYVQLRKDEILFTVGKADENMYIVESGCLRVLYGKSEDLKINLKDVHPGEPVVSLLSFIDYMAGKRKFYKTVTAKALEDTKVIKFSFECFKNAFDKFPSSLSRVVQVMMVRLQRVTLLSLHQYLGLGTDLMNPEDRGSAVKRQFSTSEDIILSNIKEKQEPVDQDQGELTVSSQVAAILKSNNKLTDLNESELKMVAMEMFRQKLGFSEDKTKVDDVAAFLNDIEVTNVEENQVLVEQDSADRHFLMLVMTGCVGVFQTSEDGELVEIHKAYPGGYLGQLQTLTLEPSFFTYMALERGKIAVVNAISVRRCMRAHPNVSVELATSVIEHLSSYVRSIDFALEWGIVESGKALYKQGSMADSTYIILSGRLRSVVSNQKGKKEMVGEYGRGELTGIVETLMKTPRSTTVIAIRDTEIAKLPAGLIDLIKMKFPNILMRLIKLLGAKLQKSWEKGPESSVGSLSSNTASMQMTALQSNLSTVAIIGLSPDIPVTPFTFELLHALNSIGSCLHLTKEHVLKTLGDNAFDKTEDFKLSSWLAQQEDKHKIVLYQCDIDLSAWTRLCIRHADVIFILANPKNPTAVIPLEESLERLAKRTRKDMIFLHTEDTKYPSNTANWLKHRSSVNAHYHIKCPPRMFFKKRLDKMELMYRKIIQDSAPSIHSDFSRLARYITGNTVGLVLGGGGARGCSHVGMIKAIQEAGIPIDTVSGVSIGSFIGGLWCQERNVVDLTVKARTFSMKMSQLWRQVFDLTYPITSYFSGHGFNVLLEEAFEKRDIRDLWLPFFTITTDITESAMRIHDYGSLWRYVRSSMSLAGYMPPLCDPHDGHLLLDGGYVNNLPADIMRLRGARHILAIDVGSQNDMDFTNYGDYLSGFSVILSKYSPFRNSVVVPNQAEIQSRLAYVSCVRTLELVKSADYCDYIRPPIDRFGTLQFGAFDEIRDVGYYHGRTYFSGLQKAGLLTQIFSSTQDESHGYSGIESEEDIVGPGNLNLPSVMRKKIRTRKKQRHLSFEENLSNDELNF